MRMFNKKISNKGVENVSELGKKLKELRKNRKISQQVIADYFGVTRGTVSNWEIGRREPDLETLEKLAKFYGVSLNYFQNENVQDDILELLARANKIFKNENVKDQDKLKIYEDLMRIYFSSKDNK